MRAIEVLREEHRVLRDVLGALELVLDRQSETDTLEADLALEALEWCERFADGLHQDREELGLFPVLDRRAPAGVKLLIQGLETWHARERVLLARMRCHIEGAAYDDPPSRDAFTVAARAYVECQRRHAEIEDVLVLPVAEAVLDPADDSVICTAYQEIEPRHVRPDEPDPLARARRLVVASLRRSGRRRLDRVLVPFEGGHASPSAEGALSAV